MNALNWQVCLMFLGAVGDKGLPNRPAFKYATHESASQSVLIYN